MRTGMQFGRLFVGALRINGYPKLGIFVALLTA